MAAWVARTRRRLRWFDHVVRAGIRYDHADGGRLTAAVTYYAFFAVFASALLGFAILGFVLDNAAILTTVQNYLAANLPHLDVQAIRNARGTVGIVAFVVLPVAGVLWIDALRSSIRAIWGLEQYPGRFLHRQVIDLGLLAGLGVLFGVSLSVSGGTQALLHWLVIDAGNADGSTGQWFLDAAGFLLGVAVNVLLAVAVLTGLPRLRMSAVRVLPPALMIAVGLAILNTLGRIYVERAEANPAYQVVAVAVGLLVFLSLLNQLILFAAAFTATSTRGTVRDFGRLPSAGVEAGPTLADRVPAEMVGVVTAQAVAQGEPRTRVTVRRPARVAANRRPPGRQH